jgi:hypothetical protein
VALNRSRPQGWLKQFAEAVTRLEAAALVVAASQQGFAFPVMDEPVNFKESGWGPGKYDDVALADGPFVSGRH